ncbi:hypothetical protein ACJMK2_036854 [Sinanodonta woodiana]|uniref:Uncharacterized protein n=1 Tax=Sinanodonta woodiana TaxID=1069815 RepID=A0ABD3WJV0_SINWO
MAGSSIFDYVHHQDHQELAEQLGIGIGSIPSNMSSPASPTEEGTSTSQRTMTPIPDRG